MDSFWSCSLGDSSEGRELAKSPRVGPSRRLSAASAGCTHLGFPPATFLSVVEYFSCENPSQESNLGAALGWGELVGFR